MLYNAAGVAGVVAYVVALLVLQAAVVLILGIETKGMSLETLSVLEPAASERVAATTL